MTKAVGMHDRIRHAAVLPAVYQSAGLRTPGSLPSRKTTAIPVVYQSESLRHSWQSINQKCCKKDQTQPPQTESVTSYLPKYLQTANRLANTAHLQKACGSSAQPYMGVRKAPLLGPYCPTEPRYCLRALTPCSTVSTLSGQAAAAVSKGTAEAEAGTKAAAACGG